MKTTPILLSSSVSLLASQLAQFKSQDLQHPFNQHMLIKEIRISLYEQSAGWSSSNMQTANLGNSIRFQFRLGRLGLTGGNIYVPAWSFGRRILETSEITRFANNTVGNAIKNSFTWVLPRPLLVPAYSALIAVATRQSSDWLNTHDATAAVTVRLAYSGVSLPKGFRLPESFDVPYVSAFADATTGTSAHSNDLDLKNTFEHPMKIQRLIGRMNYLVTNGSLLLDNDYMGTTPIVQVLTSRGDYVVNPHAQFNEVFDVLGRDLPVRSVLEPGENFAIDVTGKLDASGAVASPATMNPTVSMIGHHSMLVRDI